MKKISLFLVCVLAGLSAWSSGNPQMRACRIANGQFFVLDTGLDEIGLCRIGQSVVGAIDILNKDADIDDAPASLTDYRDGITECDPSRVVIFPNVAGTTLKICYYEDGSLIDLITLNRGKTSPLNTPLNKALGLY